LPADLLAELSRSLAATPAAALFDNDAEQSQRIRLAMRALVRTCRARDAMRVERLIIALRGWWRSSGEAARDTSVTDARWTRLVELCVEEFYGSAPA
jgi:hypothetical protein